MVSVRSAKNKGSQFEYSVFDSLKQRFPDVILTKQLGFVAQYDISSVQGNFAVECKFHKSLTWNECVKLYYKLERVVGDKFKWKFLVFKANQQPPLIMCKTLQDHTVENGEPYMIVSEFEKFFNIPFLIHGKRQEG